MKRLLLPLLILFPVTASHAGNEWVDVLINKVQESRGVAPASSLGTALSNEEIVGALKQALVRGGEKAIARLGQEGGFLQDAAVRIPMPPELKKVEKLLRKLKQDKYADEFVASMNRAAEKAVPVAADMLKESIQSMTLEDARAVLDGGEDAATRYFRKNTEEKLKERFLPIVQDATGQAGITAAYKKLLTRAGPAAALMGAQSRDVDGYITSKALDGLFLMIAKEEKLIRENPLERSSELLKKVFGSLRR